MQAEWPSPHCSHGCGWLEQPGWRDNIWVLKVKRQHMWRGADALRAFTGARHHADNSLGPGSRLGGTVHRAELLGSTVWAPGFHPRVTCSRVSYHRHSYTQQVQGLHLRVPAESTSAASWTLPQLCHPTVLLVLGVACVSSHLSIMCTHSLFL